jgi:hypothetical protein
MARLESSESALAGMDRLILSHSLPSDTRERVEASARPLERFPRFGPERQNRVVLVSVEDGRAAGSMIASD